MKILNEAFNKMFEELLEESAKTDFLDKFGQETLNNFDKAKQRLKNNNMSTDYGQYLKMSKEELDDLILSLYDDKKDAQRKRIISGTDKEIRGKYNYLGEKDGYKVYQPLDYLASMDLGVNTGWCTTGRYGHYGHPEYTPSEKDAKRHWNGYTNKDKVKFYYFLNPETMYGEYAIALYPEILKVNELIGNVAVKSTNFEIWNAEDNIDYSVMNKLPLDLIDGLEINSEKYNLETRTIKMFDKECRIQRIKDNIWDFIDLPIQSRVYNNEEEVRQLNGNCDGNENLLDKEVLPKLKQELSKSLKIGKCWIPSKEEYINLFSDNFYRIKYLNGRPYWYWTSSLDTDFYFRWYYITINGSFRWNYVGCTLGVSCMFEILE